MTSHSCSLPADVGGSTNPDEPAVVGAPDPKLVNPSLLRTPVQCFFLASEFLPQCGALAAVPSGSDPELLLKLLPEASSSCAELIRIFSETIL